MGRKMGLVLGLGLAALGTTGCTEEIEPGDYRVYRIASAEQSLSDGCYYPDAEAAPNLRDDHSTMRAAATIILYAGPEEQFFLDTGDATLDGITDGEEEGALFYVFEGETVDVEWTDPDGAGDKWTTKSHTEIEMSVDEAMVTGDSTVTTTVSCNGSGCANVPAKCVTSTEFVGTEVEDVGLEHSVD